MGMGSREEGTRVAEGMEEETQPGVAPLWELVEVDLKAVTWRVGTALPGALA